MANGNIGQFLVPGGPIPGQAPLPAPTQPGVPFPQIPGSNPAPQEETVGKWKQFLQRVRSDPTLQLTLLQIGTGLLRTPGVGQTSGDVVANAVQGGLNFFTQQKGLQGRQQLAERGVAAQEEGVAVQRESVEQRGEAARLAREQAGALAGERERNAQRRHLELIKRLEANAKAAAARYDKKDFEIVNETIRAQYGAGGLADYFDEQNKAADIAQTPLPFPTQRDRDVQTAAIVNRILERNGRAAKYIAFTEADVQQALAAYKKDPALFERGMARMSSAFGPTFGTRVAQEIGKAPAAPSAGETIARAPRSAAEAEAAAAARLETERTGGQRQARRDEIDSLLDRIEAVGATPEEKITTARNILDDPSATERQRQRAQQVLIEARRLAPSFQVPGA
jgi:hypothetical protein